LISLSVTEKGKIVILSINGDLNTKNVIETKAKIQEILEKSPEVLALDCKNLHNFDSSGLGLFINLVKTAKEKDFELFFLDLNENVSSLFDISKLDTFLTIISSEEFNTTYLG